MEAFIIFSMTQRFSVLRERERQKEMTAFSALFTARLNNKRSECANINVKIDDGMGTPVNHHFVWNSRKKTDPTKKFQPAGLSQQTFLKHFAA